MEWVLDGLVQLVTSPLIVEEYRAIVGRPKFHRFGFPPLWLEFLIEESMRLPARPERYAIPCTGALRRRMARDRQSSTLPGGNLGKSNRALANRLPGTSDESWEAKALNARQDTLPDAPRRGAGAPQFDRCPWNDPVPPRSWKVPLNVLP
jgi:hypothetical protein